MRILEAVSLHEKTTFNIGGLARYYTEIISEDDLSEALSFAKQKDIPWFVLAGGSNVLFSDNEFNGLVIHMAGTDVTWQGTTLTAEAGAHLQALIHESASRDFTGWEKMYGIPGTIGGAVRGNAGAFGTEIERVVTSVRAVNAHSLEVREFTKHECEFAYRNSFFKQHPEWIILSVTITLTQTEPGAAPLGECYTTLEERERRHLQSARCAGSFFKNPIATSELVALFEKEKNTESKGGKVPAGWLMEKALCKGMSVGDAQSSMQHPNYLINKGNASAQDVITLAQQIASKIYAQFGITLEEEVTIVR